MMTLSKIDNVNKRLVLKLKIFTFITLNLSINKHHLSKAKALCQMEIAKLLI